MENRKYGKLPDGKIEFAPRAFFEGGSIVVPKEDDDEAYTQRGWEKIIYNPPPVEEGEQEAVLSGYVQGDGVISAMYEVRDIPESEKPQKMYSKLRITLFCMNMKLWDSVKAWLQEIGYYDLFVMAQYFLGSDEYFSRALEMFKEKFREDIEEEGQDVDELVQQMLEFSYDGELQPGER